MLDEIHSFIHCHSCHARGQTERLEVGLTASGIRVDCRKHGIVVAFTPSELAEQIAQGPQCDGCRQGVCARHVGLS